MSEKYKNLYKSGLLDRKFPKAEEKTLVENQGSAAPTKHRSGLEERKDALLFKFERERQILEGHLSGIVRTTIEGKPGVDLYFCLDENPGKLVKVHATRKMLEKLRTGDTGRFISIMFLGVNENARNMREFQIMVDMKNEPRTDLVMESALLETTE